jgi:hypothetical protein
MRCMWYAVYVVCGVCGMRCMWYAVYVVCGYAGARYAGMCAGMCALWCYGAIVLYVLL